MLDADFVAPGSITGSEHHEDVASGWIDRRVIDTAQQGIDRAELRRRLNCHTRRNYDSGSGTIQSPGGAGVKRAIEFVIDRLERRAAAACTVLVEAVNSARAGIDCQ